MMMAIRMRAARERAREFFPGLLAKLSAHSGRQMPTSPYLEVSASTNTS
jgi:hypothetical protein